ncbi:MAG: beta-ketoacyl-ACP synthase 3 [Opitutales bacterium]
METISAKSGAGGAVAQDQETALQLYRWMRLSRELEEREEKIVGRGEAQFQISSGGHEAMAALAMHMGPQDWLHCHYRDRALMLARGLTAENFLDQLVANDSASSRGRQLCAMHSDRALNILTMPVSVANNLLPAVGVAAQVLDQPEAPIVYAGIGEGSTQQGDFFEAVAEAIRRNLPVLFVVQDNKYALSTITQGNTFYSLPGGEEMRLFGCELRRMDGRNALACHQQFGEIVETMRRDRGPQIVLFETERLKDHSNADDHTAYRTDADIAAIRERADPLTLMAAELLEQGVDGDRLDAINAACREEVQNAAERTAAKPFPAPDFTAIRPYAPELLERAESLQEPGCGDMTMREAIQRTLHRALSSDERVFLQGQDIEDPKGDIFGVTQGLSTAFPGRVINSPLAEATIMGTSIGRAMAGGRPVAFLQFADFFPVAYNQIHSELATIYWRSAGEWECPVVVMVACGGYRAGTGPFHTQTFESVAAHSPGIDVMMPSTAPEAAALLNIALKSQRPTLFLYPKNLLNNRGVGAMTGVEDNWIRPGSARLVRPGTDVCLVGWGNTVAVCREAAETLEQFDLSASVIDLRNLKPWDDALVTREAERCGNLIVVHEDSLSFGAGAEICAHVVERAARPVKVRRIARPDTYLPYHFPSQLALLPSVRSIIEAAAELTGTRIGWRAAEAKDASIFTIEAIGASASDDAVTVSDWLVKEGDSVAVDDVLAVIEADKAAADVLSPKAGTVERILVPEGEQVRIGTPLAELRLSAPSVGASRAPETPYLIAPRQAAAPAVATGSNGQHGGLAPFERIHVGIAGITSAKGGRVITNDELLKQFPGKLSEEVVRHSGIESRHWVAEGENVETLAAKAAAKLFEDHRADIADIDYVLCATTTPDKASPSLACRVLHHLGGKAECPAIDFSAACSGYLYGLRMAADFLHSKPDGKVLLVTTEVFSPLLRGEDYDTDILFGDAATATLIHGPHVGEKVMLDVQSPVISALGEGGESLSVPLYGAVNGMHMRGGRVFHQAVRRMGAMLHRACEERGVSIDGLDGIIPHQANLRILEAMARQLKVESERVWRNIATVGNTSSCSIPLCLEHHRDQLRSGGRYAMVAFGGGYTFGAAVAQAPAN